MACGVCRFRTEAEKIATNLVTYIATGGSDRDHMVKQVRRLEELARRDG